MAKDWTPTELLQLGEPSPEYLQHQPKRSLLRNLLSVILKPLTNYLPFLLLAFFPAFTMSKIRQSSSTRSRKLTLGTDSTSPPVTIIEKDIQIPNREGTLLPARVYTSEKSTPSNPIVILIHGGGFIKGSHLSSAVLAHHLLAVLSVPVTILSISYRLAPEFPFPAAVYDSYDCFLWIRQNAKREGFGDPEKGLVVAGVSAGANLAAVLGCLARDEGVKPRVTGLWLSCMNAFHRDNVPKEYRQTWLSWEQNKNSSVLNRSRMDFVLKCYQPPSSGPLAHLFSPVMHPNGLSELAKSYFQVCGTDPLRDDGINYEAACRKSGVETMMDVYPGLPHCWFGKDGGGEMEATKQWLRDSVTGFEWLLKSD